MAATTPTLSTHVIRVDSALVVPAPILFLSVATSFAFFFLFLSALRFFSSIFRNSTVASTEHTPQFQHLITPLINLIPPLIAPQVSMSGAWRSTRKNQSLAFTSRSSAFKLQRETNAEGHFFLSNPKSSYNWWRSCMRNLITVCFQNQTSTVSKNVHITIVSGYFRLKSYRSSKYL